MTRFEEYFPPDIVQAVYDRLNRDAAAPVEQAAANNVVNLAAYRLKVMQEGTKVVS